MRIIRALRNRALRNVVAGAVVALVAGAVAAGPATATGVVPSAGPQVPPAPPVSAPVLDDAHVLSAGLVHELDVQLGRDNGSGTAQLAVATVTGTDGLPIATYADDVFNAWGIGDRSTDDGVLILVAPGQRQVRIQTGRGLGGRLPDSTAQAIVDDQMLPAFRAGQDDQAVGAGVEAVRQELGLPVDTALPKVGETAGGPAPSAPSGSSGTSLVTVLIWVLVAVVVLGVIALLVRRGTGPGGGPGDPGGGIPYVGGTSGMAGGGGGFGGGSSGGGGATGGW